MHFGTLPRLLELWLLFVRLTFSLEVPLDSVNALSPTCTLSRLNVHMLNVWEFMLLLVLILTMILLDVDVEYIVVFANCENKRKARKSSGKARVLFSIDPMSPNAILYHTLCT